MIKDIQQTLSSIETAKNRNVISYCFNIDLVPNKCHGVCSRCRGRQLMLVTKYLR